MKLVNDSKRPELLGIIETKRDLAEVQKWVQNINKDLVDSGFDQYQYAVDLQGKEAYIRKI